MKKEKKYTTITSQKQCDDYKEKRKSFKGTYTPSSQKVYNDLTALIVAWEIKQDSSIKKQRGIN